jgi:hypothetical protein
LERVGGCDDGSFGRVGKSSFGGISGVSDLHALLARLVPGGESNQELRPSRLSSVGRDQLLPSGSSVPSKRWLSSSFITARVVSAMVKPMASEESGAGGQK